jgi:isopenicillin N synthase-like dioxygenase
LRTTDEESFWPQHPPSMKEDWITVYNQLQGLAWKCFLHMAKYAPDTKLTDPTTLSAIEEFVGKKSSISLIHYFPAAKEDLDKCMVCAEHEDTGLLTFGVRSDVPGLGNFIASKN